MKIKIIDSLISIGAVKFGSFELKSGLRSPIYIDLRIIISYPILLKEITSELIQATKELPFTRVAGIPYTALPMATAFSLETEIPMIYARKEKKKYGTNQHIEGIWNEGDQVLILDDLITTGESKFETFQIFEQPGLKITDVVVLIDREQGGAKLLAQHGYRLHSIISIFEVVNRLKEQGKIDATKLQEVMQFLQSNQVN